MNKETIILPSSDEAAKRIDGLSGWVDRHGKFWGDGPDGEHMARYSGSTHNECRGCGSVTRKTRLMCPECEAAKSRAKYVAMPRKEWDGKTPMVIHDDDKYFFGWEDVEEYAEEANCKPEDLPLVICDPVHLRSLDYDYWCEDLPDDGELPPDVEEAVDALNAVIAKQSPVAWIEGKYAAVIVAAHKKIS